ncbi:hypothetical protein [Chryseolinea lacunae]|uniref:PKD domain-containing protein n=1 Tax=Chryseolinea lacunae TaxID=2801331 RepID=A0ABS1KW67_9BACT|nr:hypothetical protein [Chryseolinea lacunae]MBL0743472.1 hypothetical protein [Chryseolinea lacunae]
MKTFRNIAFVFVVLSLVSACNNYEFPTPPYATVETLPVTDITSTSVTLHGTLVSLTTDPVLEHGFLWSYADFDTNSEFKWSLGPKTETGSFDYKLSEDIVAGKTYYVKAYVKTNGYTFYGQMTTFNRPK